MPFKLEIPIFTTDVEEHDNCSFEQMDFKELLQLCKNFNSAECRRIRLELNAVGSYGKPSVTSCSGHHGLFRNKLEGSLKTNTVAQIQETVD